MLIIFIIWIVREIMLRLKILERVTEGGKWYLPKDYRREGWDYRREGWATGRSFVSILTEIIKCHELC